MSVGHHNHARLSVHGNDWDEARRIIAARESSPRMRWRRRNRPRIVRTYDIAYIAGISNSGEVIYIDRHFPLTSYPVLFRRYDVTDELILHEGDEQIYIEYFGDHYLRAHRLVTVAEHDLVVRRRIDWRPYEAGFERFAKVDERLESITRSPSDLFLRPYIDSRDTKTLERIRHTMVRVAA